MSDVKETAERISTERLEEMLAGLKGVTLGPWVPASNHSVHRTGDMYASDGYAEVLDGYCIEAPEHDNHVTGRAAISIPEDAAHLARCDPDTMHSILTELLASRHADAQEGGEVEWASCPGCNGTGDQGGNPAYGACGDCGGSGKIGTIAALNPRKETVGVKPVAWTDQYGIEYLNAGHGIDVSAERGTMGRIIPLYAAPSNPVVSDAARDVLAERKRQVEAEGWTPEHDDSHGAGQMARAAACYAISASSAQDDHIAAVIVDTTWPWSPEWWKPTHSRRDLVKAGALILAEIDRLDRDALSVNPQSGSDKP